MFRSHPDTDPRACPLSSNSLPPVPLTQDGGDPAVEVSPRDLIFTLSAEAAADAVAKPLVLAGTDLRCGGVAWGDDDLALVYESWWKTRRSVIHTMSPGDPGAGKQILFDRRGGRRGRECHSCGHCGGYLCG